jgi:homocysteine S-methyltransferase
MTIRLLDGAMGTLLERRGIDLTGSAMWASQCLVSCPEEVAAVHAAYVRAGCDAVSTCTYQLFSQHRHSPEALSGHSPADEEVRHLAAVACELARASGARYVHAVLGPLGASLQSDAEFTGVYPQTLTTKEGLELFHRPRVAAMGGSHELIDVLGFETLPRLDEALVLADMCATVPGTLPVYFSFVTHDGKATVCGTPLISALRQLRGVLRDRMVGFGVNCCSPSAAKTAALGLLEAECGEDWAAAGPFALVIYPNMGGEYDGEARKWRPSTDSSLFLSCINDIIISWRATVAGAAPDRIFRDLWVGGCCNTTDQQLCALAVMTENYRAQ